jgi:glycosyltransferase involved in cell wall biosynthesis
MTLCYINTTKEIPPRDSVYVNGLEKAGIRIIKHLDNTPSLKKYWAIANWYRKLKEPHNLIWVGYTAHNLVPIIRLVSRKKIVFNALGSMHEGIIISRQKAGKISPLALYCWLVDFIAFHSAAVSFVESKEQKKYLVRKFFLSPEKLIVAYTGVNENIFFYDPKIKKLPAFTVLFRGGFLPESGIECAIEAAKILKNEKVNLRIIGSGMMEERVRGLLKNYGSSKIEWIRGKLGNDELREKMQECHLSLGQLSDHERLERTIPHKAFESTAMKLP